MDEHDRSKYENLPVSMGMCFFVEFLICHTLLVMVVVLVLFFATQLGLFTLNPIVLGSNAVEGWSVGRWMSLVALEGIIVIISQRYARNQVGIYERVLAKVSDKAERTGPVIDDLPSVHAPDRSPE